MTRKIYIGGPFFNPQQIEIIEAIKEILTRRKMPFYSPKDECMFVPGETTPDQILKMNVEELDDARLLIAVTDGKDPGTMFEAGYCYGIGVPVLYVWLSRQEGQKFNLMLAASGHVALSYEDLERQLVSFIKDGHFIHEDEELSYE